MWPLVEVRMYFLSVWSSLSYKQTLYLSVFLFLCQYYTRKVSIFFFLIFFRLQVCQTKWRACSLLAHKWPHLCCFVFWEYSEPWYVWVSCGKSTLGATLWWRNEKVNITFCYKVVILSTTAHAFHGYFKVIWHLTIKDVSRQVSERGALQNLVRGNCALLPCCSIQLGVYHSFPLSSAFYRFKCQSFVCHALSRVFLVLDSVNTTFDVDAIGSATLRVPRSQALARFKFPATWQKTNGADKSRHCSLNNI